jgi:hypothetical protein
MLTFPSLCISVQCAGSHSSQPIQRGSAAGIAITSHVFHFEKFFSYFNTKQNHYLAFDFPNANNPKFNTVKFSTPTQK